MTTAAQRPSPTIQLANPVAQHFESFITENARLWQIRALIQLLPLMPPDHYEAVVSEFEQIQPTTLAWSECPAFRNAVTTHLLDKIVVGENAGAGKHVVICGAGPSLREHANDYCETADEVWGCNSALTYLRNRGHRVTHGFTVDQTPSMLEEWGTAPADVTYLLASSVHPELVQGLIGLNREIRFFHNFVGLNEKPVEWPDANGVTYNIPYEDWMYQMLYPSTIRAGAGLNAVTRAIEVAQYMHFETITVLGADCALDVTRRTPTEPNYAQYAGKALRRVQRAHGKRMRQYLVSETIMHADGGNALASHATPMVLETVIDAGTTDDAIRLDDGSIFRATTQDWKRRFWRKVPPKELTRGHGKFWLTKPDMAISAQWLLQQARASDGRVRLIGDTLPNALMLKDDAYLRRLPNFMDERGNIASIPSLTEDAV